MLALDTNELTSRLAHINSPPLEKGIRQERELSGTLGQCNCRNTNKIIRSKMY
jgi:hypothetical protein